MSSELWKSYYEMFWEAHPDKSRFDEMDSSEAQQWADYLVRNVNNRGGSRAEIGSC